MTELIRRSSRGVLLGLHKSNDWYLLANSILKDRWEACTHCGVQSSESTYGETTHVLYWLSSSYLVDSPHYRTFVKTVHLDSHNIDDVHHHLAEVPYLYADAWRRSHLTISRWNGSWWRCKFSILLSCRLRWCVLSFDRVIGIEPFQTTFSNETVIQYRRSCGLHRLIIQVAVARSMRNIQLWHVLCRERRCPELYHLDDLRPDTARKGNLYQYSSMIVMSTPGQSFFKTSRYT
jgi:hypothetical protein